MRPEECQVSPPHLLLPKWLVWETHHSPRWVKRFFATWRRAWEGGSEDGKNGPGCSPSLSKCSQSRLETDVPNETLWLLSEEAGEEQ